MYNPEPAGVSGPMKNRTITITLIDDFDPPSKDWTPEQEAAAHKAIEEWMSESLPSKPGILTHEQAQRFLDVIMENHDIMHPVPPWTWGPFWWVHRSSWYNCGLWFRPWPRFRGIRLIYVSSNAPKRMRITYVGKWRKWPRHIPWLFKSMLLGGI